MRLWISKNRGKNAAVFYPPTGQIKSYNDPSHVRLQSRDYVVAVWERRRRVRRRLCAHRRTKVCRKTVASGGLYWPTLRTCHNSEGLSEKCGVLFLDCRLNELGLSFRRFELIFRNPCCKSGFHHLSFLSSVGDGNFLCKRYVGALRFLRAREEEYHNLIASLLVVDAIARPIVDA